MFKKNTAVEPTSLETAIEDATKELKGYEANSAQYESIVKQIKELHAMLPPTRELRKPVSPDALIAAGANLAGILLILNFERLGIVTSKALGFVVKSKL